MGWGWGVGGLSQSTSEANAQDLKGRFAALQNGGKRVAYVGVGGDGSAFPCTTADHASIARYGKHR